MDQLIEIAGGFRENVDSNYVEITRFISEDNHELIVIEDYNSEKNIKLW